MVTKQVLFGVVVLLCVVGILAGPVYYLYCQFLSGSSVGEYPVFDKDITRNSLLASELISGGKETWYTPISIHLSPDMNPIGFNVTAKVTPSHRKRTGGAHAFGSATYAAKLNLKDKLIWESSFDISPGKISKKEKEKLLSKSDFIFPTKNERIQAFSVTEAGEYQFDIVEEGNRLAVAGFLLKVRKNITLAMKSVFIPGFVVMVSGIVVLMLFFGKEIKALTTFFKK